MSTTASPRRRRTGRALAAACLAVTMLAGVGAVASAAPAPAAPVKADTGLVPGGVFFQDSKIIRPFKTIDIPSTDAYSFDRYQYMYVNRSATWSNDAHAVSFSIRPTSFAYWGFWWKESVHHATSVHTQAFLLKDGVTIDHRQKRETVLGSMGSELSGSLSFGNHGKGTYCIRLESAITGMYWNEPSSNISSSRSRCFDR